MNFQVADIFKQVASFFGQFLDNVTINVNGKVAFSKFCKRFEMSKVETS